MALALRVGLAAVLGVAALLKLARPRAAVESLAGLGLSSRRTRRLTLAGSVAIELALAGGVAAGSAAFAYAAAALMLVLAALLVRAILAGKSGQPCACFGPRGRIGRTAVARNLVLAGAFAALPSVPPVQLSESGWLAVGLGVALVAIAALAVAVLALAREVGMLRLRLPPEAALEVLSEGPELGRFTPIVERFSFGPEARIALAVFSSAGCSLCRALEPSIAAIGRDPLIAVDVFDEARDQDMWEQLSVPGSPYAVALDLDGTVRAKGTFNTFAQLESVIATAWRRLGAEAAPA